jgi:hypothetical protein
MDTAPISNFVVHYDYPSVISESYYQKLVAELEYTRSKQKVWVLLYRIFHWSFFRQLAKKAQRRLTKIHQLLTIPSPPLPVASKNYMLLINYLAIDAVNSLEEQEDVNSLEEQEELSL